MARARIGLTLCLWAVAFLAALWLRRRGHREPAPLLLFLAPFGLALVQPYGGEILLRVFLFALPFTAFFIASVMRRAPLPVAVAVTLLLTGAFLVTRYGNERMDWFTRGEVRAVDRLDALAPAGSTLVAWSNSLPWEARHYTAHRYRSIVASKAWPRIGALPSGSPRQIAAVARVHARAEGRRVPRPDPQPGGRGGHHGLRPAGVAGRRRRRAAPLDGLPPPVRQPRRERVRPRAATGANAVSARRVPWAAVVAVAAVAAPALALAGAPAAVRLPVVLVFLLLGPGMAFVPLLGLGDPVAELTVAVGISLAVDVAVALAMLYAGAWSPPATLVVVAALALCGAALQRVKEARPA